MDVYSVLFWDSFRSMFIFYLSTESAWFAARDFGVYSLGMVTAVCFAASMAGAACSAGLGYAVSQAKGRLFTVDEELFQSFSTAISKYGIYIFLFQMLPFIKLFVFFAGLFRVPLHRLVIVLLAGRALYYAYYLYIYPLLPSL